METYHTLDEMENGDLVAFKDCSIVNIYFPWNICSEQIHVITCMDVTCCNATICLYIELDLLFPHVLPLHMHFDYIWL